jgi:hypothetical protein
LIDSVKLVYIVCAYTFFSGLNSEKGKEKSMKTTFRNKQRQTNKKKTNLRKNVKNKII